MKEAIGTFGKSYEHYGKLELPTQDEVVKMLDNIPCKILKKASKGIPCGMKGCYRCKRWFYEINIKGVSVNTADK